MTDFLRFTRILLKSKYSLLLKINERIFQDKLNRKTINWKNTKIAGNK